MFISADGEDGKAFGNETIRVAPHGNDEYTVTIRLPSPFAHLSNTPGRTPTYRLSAPIRWHHLAREWEAQASADRAVGYHIRLDADRGSVGTSPPRGLSHPRRALELKMRPSRAGAWR